MATKEAIALSEQGIKEIPRQETTRKDEKTNLSRRIIPILSIIFNITDHILIIFLTCFILYFGFQGSTVMLLHVVLCTLAYVLFLAEGMLVFRSENVWSRYFNKSINSYVHLVLQVIGSILAIVGVVVMSRVKKHNFTSTHGILGLISIIIMILLLIFGYPVFISYRLRKLIRPVIIKFVHNILGSVCFIFGMAALCFSYDKKWIPENDSYLSLHHMTLSLTPFSVIMTILTLIGAFRTLYNLVPAVFR